MIILLLAIALSPVRASAASLPVVVVETPTTVELRLRMEERIDPGSVEVEIAGRTVTVHARDARSGEPVYERRLRVREPVMEEDAAAEYDGKWLTVVLRKQLPVPAE